MALTIGELYELGIEQGWDPDDAYMMAAIAWAESKGVPNEWGDISPEHPYGSVGLWQINDAHFPDLVDAGILVAGEGSAVDQLFDPIKNAQAAYYVGHHMGYSNPTEDWQFGEWTVTHDSYKTHNNYYENYFPMVDGYLSGTEVEPPVVEPPTEEEPPAEGGITPGLPSIPEMERLMTPVYGGGPGGGVVESPLDPPLYPDLTYGQLEFWTNHFAQGNTYDFDGEENMIAAEFMQSKMAETDLNVDTGHGEFKASGDYARAIRDFDTKLAGMGWEIEYQPLGWSWMWLWGRENEEVKNFLDDWVERFNDSRNSQGGVDDPTKWTDDTLFNNFMNHTTGGLGAQDWWMQRTGNWENAQQLWYQSQPTGGLVWQGPEWEDPSGPGDYMEIAPRYGEGEGLVEGRGGTLPDTVQRAWFVDDDFAGDPGSKWGNAWQQTKTMVQTTIENMGTRLAGQVSESFVNRMVMELMQNGGATFALGGRDASQWAEEATMMIEAGVREEYMGISAEGSDWGPGRFQDVIDTLNNRLRSQMFTPSPDFIREHGSVEDWAMDIIGGEEAMGTFNLSQRMDFIDNHAWNQATGTFGLTEDDLAALRAGVSTTNGIRTGGSIRGLLQPLVSAANTTWGGADYGVDDQWLIDNYMLTDDQGTRRRRNAQEMGNHARTNLPRFAQSDEYQNWGNQFMAGAASMFRSDY